MAQYNFAADRQLIFHVNVGGMLRLVQFGERNQFGASNYQTDNPKVAAAIRRNSMYKRGVIKEMTTEQPEKPAAKPQGTVAEPQGTVADVKELEDLDATEEGVITVENFTQAKAEVMRRLGLDAKEVKNPAMLGKVAKENGLKIKYVKK